ncbi:hypothetical protein D3C85_839760 [compost metagenome]
MAFLDGEDRFFPWWVEHAHQAEEDEAPVKVGVVQLMLVLPGGAPSQADHAQPSRRTFAQDLVPDPRVQRLDDAIATLLVADFQQPFRCAHQVDDATAIGIPMQAGEVAAFGAEGKGIHPWQAGGLVLGIQL